MSGANDADDRPEVWMFTADGDWCQPCNSAKAFFKEHGHKLPFKVIIKHGMPDWLNGLGYPTFYWGVKTESGGVKYWMMGGWVDEKPLVDAWKKSCESKIEKAYRNAELKIGMAAQRKWRSITEKDGILPRDIIEPAPSPLALPQTEQRGRHGAKHCQRAFSK